MTFPDKFCEMWCLYGKNALPLSLQVPGAISLLILFHRLLTFDKHPEEGREVEIADEDDGRAERRDAAAAALSTAAVTAIPARGGISDVAAVIGLEQIETSSTESQRMTEGLVNLRHFAPH